MIIMITAMQLLTQAAWRLESAILPELNRRARPPNAVLPLSSLSGAVRDPSYFFTSTLGCPVL